MLDPVDPVEDDNEKGVLPVNVIKLAPSGALVFIMGYYIHTYIQGHFFRFFKFGAMLPIYITFTFIQKEAILLHELH